ncbi:MAG: 2,3-bisphosphoglycerate-independent phosphoglycerate mutase [Maritimibacter sp.]
MTTPKPVCLCILDGFGIREERENNAVKLANTPTFDKLIETCPSAQLTTDGRSVGLPEGQMGNSEVGHTNIGAGRIVAMDLGMIDLAIEDGEFEKQPALTDFIRDVKRAGGTAHLVGLTSPGGVHSHQDHIIAAAKTITEAGVPVAIHVITDGRDVPPKSGREQVAAFEAALPEGAKVVSVSGRYYAMDRDNRWERVALAYDAMMKAMGETAATADEAIANAYERGETDEFVKPTVLTGHTGIHDHDGIFCINFRADRARELLRAIGEPGFADFDVGARPNLSALLGMVEYSTRHNDYMTTVFPPRDIVNTLGSWVAKHGLKQFRLSAAEVGDKFIEVIHAGYDMVICNFANPDMVGHTGDLQAAIKAVETVDTQLGRVIEALDEVGGAVVVTADHGNCETMVNPKTGGPHTAHTNNPVPVVMFGGPEGVSLRDGILSDLAPTLLQLMGLEQPEEMTGKSLIVQ